MLGALGGVLGLVALVLPAFQVSRTGVIRHRQEAARPTALPAFQRYYVDVLLLIVSIYLFRQLTEQGSVVATDLLGESAVNELLLALPGLTLIAAAIVLLRIFPIAMNLAGRLLSGSIPAGLVMGIWQMARSPTHYARLSLLLILAAGLGIFASSFGATLDRSFLERVLHSTGADVKVEGIQGRDFTDAGAAALAAEYEGVAGVDTATAVLRKTGQELSRLTGVPFEMFGVDPAVFGDVAFFREDYAGEQIETLLPRLEQSPPGGLELPQGAESLIVRVKPDRPHPGVRVTVQTRDVDGAYRTLSLGRLESGDWEDLAAEIPEGLGRTPVSLVSLRIHETDPFLDLQAGSLLLDEISVSTPGGDVTLESFDAVDWTPLLGTDEAISDAVAPAGEALPGETGSALFTWSEGAPQTIRGIFKGSGRAPIPALASRALVEDTGHVEGDEFEVLVAGHRVPILLAGVLDLFPTVGIARRPIPRCRHRCVHRVRQYGGARELTYGEPGVAALLHVRSGPGGAPGEGANPGRASDRSLRQGAAAGRDQGRPARERRLEIPAIPVVRRRTDTELHRIPRARIRLLQEPPRPVRPDEDGWRISFSIDYNGMGGAGHGRGRRHGLGHVDGRAPRRGHHAVPGPRRLGRPGCAAVYDRSRLGGAPGHLRDDVRGIRGHHPWGAGVAYTKDFRALGAAAGRLIE